MPGNYVALMLLCVLMVLVGLWIGWICWGRYTKYAEAKTKTMTAGYRAALAQTVEALELWERTRGGWTDDGMTTTPVATAMTMARALGFGRTALLAESKTPNAELCGGPR